MLRACWSAGGGSESSACISSGIMRPRLNAEVASASGIVMRKRRLVEALWTARAVRCAKRCAASIVAGMGSPYSAVSVPGFTPAEQVTIESAAMSRPMPNTTTFRLPMRGIRNTEREIPRRAIPASPMRETPVSAERARLIASSICCCSSFITPPGAEITGKMPSTRSLG